MKKLIVILFITLYLTSCNSKANTMSTLEIFPKGELLPKDWFTGNAYLKSLVARDSNN